MKAKLTIVLLLLAFAAQAKYTKATVLFRDGHIEEGLVNSFSKTGLRANCSLNWKIN
jgi:hypothetical protein